VKPRAASVPAGAEGYPCNFRLFWGWFFVILKSFNVFFCLVLIFIICNVDVTKKERKRKEKKKYSESVRVFVFFYVCYWDKKWI
jgi:uncharacterized membrane protein